MLMAKKKRFLLSNRNSIFRDYKGFADEEKKKGLGVETEIQTISEYVNIYKYLVRKSKKNPVDPNFEFGYFMHQICNSMDFYPAIFTIANCDAVIEERQRMIFLLESYVIRRHICKMTSGAYNKQAPRICEAIGNKPSYEKLDEFLKGSQDSETREFPNDKEVETSCLSNNFYNKNKLKKYIFDRIVYQSTDEMFDEKRDTKGLTIDHIMPQAWREKNEWAQELEKIKEEEVDRKIHTIGNLTPMAKGLNSQKSNHHWTGPKGAQSWLSNCDLKLTRNLAKKPSWGIDDIDERSRELATIICEIWPVDIE